MRAVLAIDPVELDRHWPKAEPLIAAALERGNGGYWPEDVREAVREKKAILWLGLNDGVPEMAAVTEIVQHARKRSARLWLLGGRDVKGWILDGMGALDEWARAEGCGEWELQGREGWIKTLPDWNSGGVVMRRPL